MASWHCLFMLIWYCLRFAFSSFIGTMRCDAAEVHSSCFVALREPQLAAAYAAGGYLGACSWHNASGSGSQNCMTTIGGGGGVVSCSQCLCGTERRILVHLTVLPAAATSRHLWMRAGLALWCCLALQMRAVLYLFFGDQQGPRGHDATHGFKCAPCIL